MATATTEPARLEVELDGFVRGDAWNVPDEVPIEPEIVSIYSKTGRLLGRAPLGFLWRWDQAAYAITPNGSRFSKLIADDEYCYPMDCTPATKKARKPR